MPYFPTKCQISLIAGVPFLVATVVVVATGGVADLLINAKLFSPTNARKLLVFIG